MANGSRVKKNAASITLYWYGSMGNVLDETTGSGALLSDTYTSMASGLLGAMRTIV